MPVPKDTHPQKCPPGTPIPATCWGRGHVIPCHLLTVYSAGTPWHSGITAWHHRVMSQGREGAVRPGAAPAAPPPLGRHRVPRGARPTPCPGLTCDGVGVVVPGLLGDVEDAGGHCPCPARQFAVGTVSGHPLRTGATQPCSAKHSLVLGPPSHPRNPTCYLAPPPPPQDTLRDPHLHLRTLICTPAPLPGATATSPAPASVFQHCHVHPQGPLSPPQDPHPCPTPHHSPSPPLQDASRDPHLHLRTSPGSPVTSPGASFTALDHHLHLTTPSGTPVASPVSQHSPTKTPAASPAPSSAHQDPPGICANSSSPPQCPHPLLRFPTSSPDTLTPSPGNTHPPSWALTPSPGPLHLPRAEPPWVLLSLPSTPAGSGPLGSREVGFA